MLKERAIDRDYHALGAQCLASGDTIRAHEYLKLALRADPGNVSVIDLLQSVVAQSEKAQNAPPILVISLPKSGTVFIAAALRNGLGLFDKMDPLGQQIALGELQIAGGRFPDIWVNYAMLRRFARLKNGGISIAHLPPSTYNAMIVDSYLNKCVVNVRDPRQAVLSLTHYFNELLASEPLLMATYSLPDHYRDLSLAQQLDYQIDHSLPQFVDWIAGWLDVSTNPGFHLEILLTRFEDLQSDPEEFFRKISLFYGLDPSSFRCPEPPKKDQYHFRKGSIDEWRQVFSADQARTATEMIPDRLFETFDWHR